MNVWVELDKLLDELISIEHQDMMAEEYIDTQNNKKIEIKELVETFARHVGSKSVDLALDKVLELMGE